MKLCKVKDCNNITAPNRKECYHHRYIRSRDNDPVRYIFYDLKHSAKNRNINFELTLEQFREFCNKTNHHLTKGKSKTGFSIDRKNSNKGYLIDNIRSIPLGINSKLNRGSFTEADMEYFPIHGTVPF